MMGQGTESCGGYDVEYNPYEECMADGLWTQRDGSTIHISKMSTRHIRNTIRLCENQMTTANFSCDQDMWQEWIDAFEGELYSRGDSVIEIKAPAKYTSPEKVKNVRGAKLNLVCHCGNKYSPRVADLKRGWAKSCCKRCAAIKRDFGRRDPVCAETGVNYKELIK